MGSLKSSFVLRQLFHWFFELCNLPKICWPFLSNMKYACLFDCLNLNVRPFKGFMLDLSKIAMLASMLAHFSIDPS